MIAIIITLVAVQLISLAIFINEVRKGYTCMANAVQDLTNAVTNLTTVSESMVAFVQTIAAKLKEISTDPVAIEAMADQINANAKKLADAIVANTPADTTTPAPTEGNPV